MKPYNPFSFQRTCTRCKRCKPVAGGIMGGRNKPRVFICADCVKARKEKP